MARPLHPSAAQQELALARVYNIYRSVLALVLLSIYLSTSDQRLVGSLHSELFLFTANAYLLASVVIALALARSQQPPTPWQNLFNIGLDLLALLLVIHASGGVSSGLALLLIVSVAAASIQLPAQLALLVAALASIGLLVSTGYLMLTGSFSSRSLLTAGLTGALYFATSLFISTLARRIRNTQQLAQARAEDVDKLLQLNQQIVRRMRTGVLVADPQSELRMLNQSARELLHINESTAGRPTLEDSPRLSRELARWRQDPWYQPPPFRTMETGPELLVRFTSLSEHGDGDTLVFIEDYAQLTQRAQQLKLASLGRLTASIAHEIRNPLGAISHAAQLLESGELNPTDRRLAEIVQNHSRRINGIIENVLQLSRRRAPNPRPLHLDSWLQQLRTEFQQCHPAARIEIRGDPSCVVSVDSDQLHQVLTNLLDNALRYSEQASGEAYALLAISQMRSTGLWALDVIDHGPGVDEGDKEKIFEPFYTTASQGSGLGLYLARELCEINQARLDYLRGPTGKGAFRISFAHPDRKPLMEYPLQENA